MELLKKLYKVYSPSGKERTMIKFIWNYTKRITGTKVETDAVGNLYITKGEAESYPCIVAHLDQVQRLHSKDFTIVETGEIIFGYSSQNKRQEGLGADDLSLIHIFVAIDLETATSHINSIGEIGIVKNSIVIESKLILG